MTHADALARLSAARELLGRAVVGEDWGRVYEALRALGGEL